uniref:Docking protein 2-like n=1 Tax=Gouania willdenowi TaxID=441366 RepID=A0A8C5G215_GOUWI
MDEDISKQGALFLQQGRFGKKWKRVWVVLYRDSSSSVSRLEFFECKDDRMPRKLQEHKKVVRLSDCIRVSEVELDGCPRNTFPFLLETTDKIFVFATDRQQLEDWTQRLCEIAFPRGSVQRGRREEEEGMEDNTLYGGRDTVCDFKVCVRRTEASDRCRLRGDIVLRAGPHALLLLDRTGDVQFSWPYRYLRRFGRDKTSFSFEAGRRCDSGEGSFEFDTRQGNLLFQAIEGAINLQRTCNHHLDPPHSTGLPPPPPPPNTALQRATPYSTLTPPSAQACLECPVERVLTAVKSLTLEDDGGFPFSRKNTVKINTDSEAGSAPEVQPYSQISVGAPPAPPTIKDPDYSLPFDSLSSSLNHRLGADPLYDSIDEMKIRNVFPVETYYTGDHIYDEPEGCATTRRPTLTASLYDDPEEVRGDAWRVMGSTIDPKGHEYPYDPRIDDYAVPKRPRKAALSTQNTNEEEEGEKLEVELKEELQDSPYKNIKIRLT